MRTENLIFPHPNRSWHLDFGRSSRGREVAVFCLGKLQLLGHASTWGILRLGSNAPAASALVVEHSKFA
jgi:hypothetical protein